MDITIYIDLFFLWNLIVDYVILSIITLVRKQKAAKGRRLLGALVGSVLSVVFLIYFQNIHKLFIVLSYVPAAVLIILVTFGTLSKKAFIKNYLFFILTANCAAGILMSMGITSGLSMMDLIEGYNSIEEGIINKNAIYIFFYAMSYIIPILLFLIYKIRIPEDDNGIYEVKIIYRQKAWHGIGFLDTGNLLINPVNGKPVILIEKKYFEELIGDGFTATEDAMLMLPSVCVIPFSSAGKSKGILYGITTSEVILSKNGEKWNTFGVVAAYCEKLIPPEKNYHILINPRMIT